MCPVSAVDQCRYQTRKLSGVGGRVTLQGRNTPPTGKRVCSGVHLPGSPVQRHLPHQVSGDSQPAQVEVAAQISISSQVFVIGECAIVQIEMQLAAEQGDPNVSERAWNPLPETSGRGFYDGVKGKKLSKPDHRWRRATEIMLSKQGNTQFQAREIRKEFEESALTLTSALAAMYGTLSLGNVADPVEEIIFMILSRQAPIPTARKVLDQLVALPGGLQSVLVIGQAGLEEYIRPLGIQKIRANQIISALEYLKQEFSPGGIASSLQHLCDKELLVALERIPGISRKTALCVMLYSFGRDVLPVDAHVARIIQRLQILKPLSILLEGLEQKSVQLLVEEALPPSTRGSFHVNAIHHGRAFCRPKKPLCDSCPLRLLCATGREELRARNLAEKRLTLVDMFCGAGGLSEGFRRAGYRTVLAVDADAYAMRTYRLNHPEVDETAMLCRDIRGFRNEAEEIRRITKDMPIDVLVGGPPCQGFSRAGLRAKAAHGAPKAGDDERNHLYQEVVDLLEVLRPRAIVMENVPGMGEVKYEDGSTFVDAARGAMKAAGYDTTTWLLNAAAYGVAQERIRRIIVGVRDGPAPQDPPPPTHHAPTLQHNVDSMVPGNDLPQAVTLGQHLRDLPPLEAAQGQNISGAGGVLLTGHVARFNNDQDLTRFRELRQGESYRKLIARRPDLKCYSDKSFPDKYFKMLSDRPARTIVAHLQRDGNGYIHPDQVRSITPREAARLQSFGDDYLFTGPLTRIYRQVGNAVPPLLAEAIGRHLKAHLDKQSGNVGVAISGSTA
jgi:DNA (cytosine-5)-methyltransferase 1